MIHITDLVGHVCPPDATVRDALVKINASPHLFQLVIDGAGRLLGTLTDGDIRRGMLQGVDLDTPVAACMRSEPITARIDDDERQTAARLRAVRRRPGFLPLVDDGGVLRAIMVEPGDGDGANVALVMAGGFGRRLGERTSETPKPLLPVGGRPILDHVIERLEADNVDTVFVAVHYRADKIRAFLAGRPGTARVEVLEETEPMGTAGALGLLPDPGFGPVLVVNGDVITRASFSALRDFHARHGLDATVGVTRYDIDVPFGVIRFGEDGLFAGIDEKPRISNFVAAGVYYLTPEFTALVPGRGAIDMPELLNLGRTLGLRIGLFPIHEYWTDVGRPDDLDTADRVARENGGASP